MAFILSCSLVCGFEHAVKLNNGVEMPVLAFGANVWDAATCKTATAAALEAGFRFVWSSTLIGADCQAAQAQAIAASSVKNIFVAGTVNTESCSDAADCLTATTAGAESQFKTLGVKTLDMLMLDYPSGSCAGIAGQWR